MDITQFSRSFDVRRLDGKDVELIYDMSRENHIFYKYHPPFVTRESILEDMAALPPGKDYKDKIYCGFFEKNTLISMMDLILDYPEKGIGFIGLFMMNASYQGKGIGSMIINELLSYMRKLGYSKIRIGVDKGNPQSFAFWRKNGFVTYKEDNYFHMELAL